MNKENDEEFEVVATGEPETETEIITPPVFSEATMRVNTDPVKKKDYVTEIVIGIIIVILITGIFMYINNRKAKGDVSYE